MIPYLRHDFNQRFCPEAYRRMLHSLDACIRTHVELRIAETPCFFPKKLLDEMAATGAELVEGLVHDLEYLKASREAIPPECRVANETPHPHFAAADFCLVNGGKGKAIPQLVHIHASPPAFGFQLVLNELYRSAYELDHSLRYLLGGHTESSFWKLMERTVRRGHHPEHVVLAGMNLEQQKSFPDVLVIAERLGIEPIEMTKLEPDAAQDRTPHLCYRKGGKRVPIYRIYNYSQPDDFGCGQAELLFDPRDSFEVEWAGHPNWGFHISRFALPYLHHPAVVPAVFLDDWLSGKGRHRLPRDPAQRVLKPISPRYGKDINAPSDHGLTSIPKAERRNYLIQKKTNPAIAIDTPSGEAELEVRILYLWPDGGRLEPVLSQARLTRAEWSGVSAVFYEDHP